MYIIKPNEHEAHTLTGIRVADFSSAKKAAQKLLTLHVENVLITVGKDGGYLFGRGVEKHMPVPKIKQSAIRDETGCGDQTIAAISASLTAKKELVEAVEIGLHAGALQFQNAGIVPVTREQLGWKK